MGKTVAKVLGFAAMAVAVVALTMTGAGLLLLPAGTSFLLGGMSAATLMTISGAMALGASLLAPSPKAPGIGKDALDRLNASLDPRAPRKAIFGTTAMATDVRDAETNPVNNNDHYVWRFIVCAAHAVESIDEIWFEEDKVWTKGSGVIKYNAHLGVWAREEGNAGNAVVSSARMGNARRYTGCAYIALRFKINSDTPFGSSIPTRITIRGKGMRVYDPRKDSTQPGGSGAHRADNQATWDFTGGHNPALQLLTWLLGWRINGRLSVGKGIPVNRLDIPAFIAAANACDETVTTSTGTEKRYETHGIVSEGDDVMAVVDRWKLSMNATLDDVDGLIRPQVLVNDLASYAASFNDNDLASGEYSWKPFQSLQNSANIFRGSYVDASDKSLYQLAEYPEVVLSSPDGIDRWETVDFGMVQSRSQARRIAKGRLQRSQFAGYFQALFQITAWKVQKGDPVRLTNSRYGFVNKLFRVAELEHRPDGLVPLVLREEDASIYAWDNSEGPDPIYPEPITLARDVAPWYLLATGIVTPPAAVDSNLLADDVFGGAWTRTFGERVFIDYSTVETGWPVKGSRPWNLEIALTSQPSAVVIAEHLPVSNGILAGRPYYLRSRVAKRTDTVGTLGLFRVYLRFDNAAGAQVGLTYIDWYLADLPADGSYQEKVTSIVAPAGTVKATVFAHLGDNNHNGAIRWEAPALLDKQPGADVTATTTGPTEVVINYDYLNVVVAGQLPKTLTYQVNVGGTNVGAGLTGTWRVITGTVNGLTAASGPQPLTPIGAGGSVTLSLTSLGTNTAEISVEPLLDGKLVQPLRTNIRRNTAQPPVTGGSGGGGDSFTLTTGFGWISTYNVITALHATAQELTVASGETVTLTANLEYQLMNTGQLERDVSWKCKFQRETSPGVWADVGAESPEYNSGFNNDPELGTTEWPALIAFSRTESPSAGTHKYRLVGWRTNPTTGNRDVAWTGAGTGFSGNAA